MLNNLFSFLSGPTHYENLSGQDFVERVKKRSEGGRRGRALGDGIQIGSPARR